ncbi:MAG: hypothetical protein HYY16_07205 [Planctomycetes bacterium]|nr:hypothetical protein [Planctomycetota bacterium]
MVNLPKLVKKTLADVVLQDGLVPQNQLSEAMNRQKSTGEPLGGILQRMGAISEIELARALSKQFNLPYIDASRYSVPKDVAEMAVVGVTSLPELGKYPTVVLDKIGKVLLMAVADMPPPEVLEGIERSIGTTIFVFISTTSQIQAAVKKYYPNGSPVPVAKPDGNGGGPAAKPQGTAPPASAAAAKPAPAAPTLSQAATQAGFKVIPAKPKT